MRFKFNKRQATARIKRRQKTRDAIAARRENLRQQVLTWVHDTFPDQFASWQLETAKWIIRGDRP